jgi:hypothetical protein
LLQGSPGSASALQLFPKVDVHRSEDQHCKDEHYDDLCPTITDVREGHSAISSAKGAERLAELVLLSCLVEQVRVDLERDIRGLVAQLILNQRNGVAGFDNREANVCRSAWNVRDSSSFAFFAALLTMRSTDEAPTEDAPKSGLDGSVARRGRVSSSVG